jgi:hypothetical protein
VTDQGVLVGCVEGAKNFFFGQRDSDGAAGLEGLYTLPCIWRLLRDRRCGSSEEQRKAKYVVECADANVTALLRFDFTIAFRKMLSKR